MARTPTLEATGHYYRVVVRYAFDEQTDDYGPYDNPRSANNLAARKRNKFQGWDRDMRPTVKVQRTTARPEWEDYS